MHKKTVVADLIEEIYVSLRQADEVAIKDLFKALRCPIHLQDDPIGLLPSRFSSWRDG